jgi:outer membrane receptor protein involved in Fe transport
MDGYLLSNFLGRFDAPRWNMIAPEEMRRVEVLYGPFSALYPGNSIGTTIAITTSRPTRFEGSVRVAMQDQSFDQYGSKDHYRNYQGSALIGDRLASGLWYKLMVNHQDSTSQPMGYYTATANAAGVFAPPAVGGAVTPVTGIRYDTGPFGARRAIFGANAGAIDHTRQNTVKATFGYDINRGVSAEGFVAWWNNESVTRNQSFMRDAAGNAVWSGRVGDGANVFLIPVAAFAPTTRDERHVQTGVTVKTRYGNGWNGSVSASAYRILEDVQRNAGGADPFAAGGGAGNAVLRDGSGFNSLDLRRPCADLRRACRRLQTATSHPQHRRLARRRRSRIAVHRRPDAHTGALWTGRVAFRAAMAGHPRTARGSLARQPWRPAHSGNLAELRAAQRPGLVAEAFAGLGRERRYHGTPIGRPWHALRHGCGTVPGHGGRQ